jgi:hypothetical protein
MAPRRYRRLTCVASIVTALSQKSIADEMRCAANEANGKDPAASARVSGCRNGRQGNAPTGSHVRKSLI